MRIDTLKSRLSFTLVVILCLAGMLFTSGMMILPGERQVTGNEIDSVYEVPSFPYDSILYVEIGPRLLEIERNSQRVKVDIIGQSAGDRDLHLVTLADPKAMGNLGQYMALRNMMLKDPDNALEMID